MGNDMKEDAKDMEGVEDDAEEEEEEDAEDDDEGDEESRQQVESGEGKREAPRGEITCLSSN